jgi:hypothetical protein
MQCTLVLGAFAKFRKANINFVMFVHPSARNYSAPTRRIIIRFHIWVIFENRLENIKIFFFNSEETNTYINHLNAELNPIRHLLALVEAHHFVDVTRLRVNWTFMYDDFSLISS